MKSVRQLYGKTIIQEDFYSRGWCELVASWYSLHLDRNQQSLLPGRVGDFLLSICQGVVGEKRWGLQGAYRSQRTGLSSIHMKFPLQSYYRFLKLFVNDILCKQDFKKQKDNTTISCETQNTTTHHEGSSP